jgi:prohibitin 2
VDITSYISIQQILRIVKICVITLVVVLLIAGSFFTIDSGNYGVVLRWREMDRVVAPGLHFKLPLIEDVVSMVVRIQKGTVITTATSRDLQAVETAIALNYSLRADKVGDIYKQIGLNQEVNDTIIDPLVKEAFKATMARYAAAELTWKRDALKAEMQSYLKDRLAQFGIEVIELSITDFSFSRESR